MTVCENYFNKSLECTRHHLFYYVSFRSCETFLELFKAEWLCSIYLKIWIFINKRWNADYFCVVLWQKIERVTVIITQRTIFWNRWLFICVGFAAVLLFWPFLCPGTMRFSIVQIMSKGRLLISSFRNAQQIWFVDRVMV